jgi:hypothetical protein
MGREDYLNHMRQRLSDLGLQIASVRTRLADSPENRIKVDLAGQLAVLEYRRHGVREKVEALTEQPDGAWEELRLEIEDEWDTLVQDFEERIASLA